MIKIRANGVTWTHQLQVQCFSIRFFKRTLVFIKCPKSILCREHTRHIESFHVDNTEHDSCNSLNEPAAAVRSIESSSSFKATSGDVSESSLGSKHSTHYSLELFSSNPLSLLPRWGFSMYCNSLRVISIRTLQWIETKVLYAWIFCPLVQIDFHALLLWSLMENQR